ncbi:MAG: hypothetical protein ACR2K5_07720 [Pseudolabrys sp.]
MSPAVKEILQHVASWPEEDQEELAEVAREIEARRSGVYVLSPDERKAIEEALDELKQGNRVPESEMQAFWKRVGAA